MALFGHTVAYTVSYDVPQVTGKYLLRFPEWLGSVAEVYANDQLAGHAVSQPWEVDVTKALRPGRNQLEVRIVGTLKNTLGPHHGQPVLGQAWPGAFRAAPSTGLPPGQNYHTVGYGLFAEPQLVHVE